MNPDRESPVRVGQEWYLVRQRLCVKKYPTCYFMHRSFDAAVKMVGEHMLKADDIATVEVTMGKGQAASLVNVRPKTGLEAKFSEQFAMAAAAILGRMDVADVSDDVVRRADMQAFFPKVKLNTVDEIDPRDPVYAPTERVVMKLANGETLDSGPIAKIRGHAYDPLSRDELWQKFESCTTRTHAKSDAAKLFDMLQSVDTLRSANDLPTCDRIFVPAQSEGRKIAAPVK